MSGTRAGGLKTKAKNLAQDPDFYRKIGGMAQASWERNGRKPRGFAAGERGRMQARICGAQGGRMSRRGHTRLVLTATKKEGLWLRFVNMFHTR